MRSLHVITSDARRGAETHAVHLARGLAAVGEDARVVALSPRSVGQDGGGRDGLDVEVLGPGRRAPSTLGALRRAGRGADVVVAHGSSTLEASVVALARTGVPVVYRSIGDPRYWVQDPVRRTAVGMLLRRTRRAVALWDDAGEALARLHGLSPDRVDVVPNAVPADRFLPASDDERATARARFGVAADRPCVAFVGALTREKDVGAAIAAVERVAGAVLLVAGDGPERTRLQALADRQFGDRVRFLGTVEDPRPVYVAADLLVLPSRSEGMPGVVIEAGLVGTPTVATPVGALPSMLDEHVTGFLTGPATDEDTLAATIRTALPRARTVGAAAADAFARRYTVEQVVPTWRAVLDRAAGARVVDRRASRRRASGERR